MNMKDDLITQIYIMLSIGISDSDNSQYKHNIVDISLTNDDEITIYAEDYDGEILPFKLKLEK